MKCNATKSANAPMTFDDLPLILASRSPRRHELLVQAGYDFLVVLPDEETEDEQRSNESPIEFVRRLAVQKAENVASKIKRAPATSIEGHCSDFPGHVAPLRDRPPWIIACDTIVLCGNKILGKPMDRQDAQRMFRLLRGERHQVLSGLCVLGADRAFVRSDTTDLYMRPISDSEIEDYLDTGLWVGKAGAFGYQDHNAWISIIHGSESNVVGLPMELLEATLALASATTGYE